MYTQEELVLLALRGETCWIRKICLLAGEWLTRSFVCLPSLERSNHVHFARQTVWTESHGSPKSRNKELIITSVWNFYTQVNIFFEYGAHFNTDLFSINVWYVRTPWIQAVDPPTSINSTRPPNTDCDPQTNYIHHIQRHWCCGKLACVDYSYTPIPFLHQPICACVAVGVKDQKT